MNRIIIDGYFKKFDYQLHWEVRVNWRAVIAGLLMFIAFMVLFLESNVSCVMLAK